MHIGEIEEWESMGRKINVSLMRRIDGEGNKKYWGLCTTFKPREGREAFEIYKKRTKIEEVNKQMKTNWRINKFSSPNESLIEAHVLFTLLTYSLIQLYLMKKHLTELANKAIDNLRAEERLGKDCVIVYYEKKFVVLNLKYYTSLILNLEEGAKKRLNKWIVWEEKKWKVRDS